MPYSSDGNIHTLDSVLVLAGSATVEGKGKASQYQQTAEGKNRPKDAANTAVAFDYTFGKNEKRINGGYIVPPSAPIEGVIWEDADYDGIRQEGEKGIGDVRLRLTKYYLDDEDKGAQNADGTYERPEGTWKRTYAKDDNGNLIVEPYINVTTSLGTDELTDLELGEYETELVPTSFRKPDATGDVAYREYLCGYTLAVSSRVGADGQGQRGLWPGYTLTRPHDATDKVQDAVESDMYRYEAKDGLEAADGRQEAFPLVNRFVEADGVRADGMIIVAQTSTSSSKPENVKTYNGVTYDVSRNVQHQKGGNGGLVKIPTTTIEGVVWDDSFQDQGSAAENRAERDRSYNGIRDSWTAARWHPQDRGRSGPAAPWA